MIQYEEYGGVDGSRGVIEQGEDAVRIIQEREAVVSLSCMELYQLYCRYVSDTSWFSKFS